MVHMGNNLLQFLMSEPVIHMPDYPYIILIVDFRCDQQAALYGYSVEYSGVGEPPVGSEDLGHCSQIAVFQHQGENMVSHQEDCSDQMPYSMVSLSCYILYVLSCTVLFYVEDNSP